MKMTLAAVSTFLSLVVFTPYATAWYEYAGIMETDKGQGVYVLEERDANYPATPNAWGGAIAEFRRRHPDKKVVATTSIEMKFSWGRGSNTRTVGIIIITDPK